MTSQAGVLEAEESSLESRVISRLYSKYVFEQVEESNEPSM